MNLEDIRPEPKGPKMEDVDWARRVLSEPDVARAIAIMISAAEADENTLNTSASKEPS